MIEWRKPKENYGVRSITSKCGDFLIKKKCINCYQVLFDNGAMLRIIGVADNLVDAKELTNNFVQKNG